MKPISKSLRSPIEEQQTRRSTMITACDQADRGNPSMAVVTLSDCSETMPNSIPSGICGFYFEVLGARL